MAPRVSVIVAVYNPGPHFETLIDSFLQQTLPASDFEVLLCDDGSDEATLARLDAVSAAHPHLRTIKLPHSGWPGTPRNHGIDIAAGTYVFFCDHDDRMGPEALQRLADYADENSSDVVVGKMVGVGRALPRGMFRRNIARAELGRDPLLEILTPHKLFRTQFIREHGIRFPDGRVRLEDHLFVMTSYFAADVISILADYPCYYWIKRDDRPSASATRIDPVDYFHHLEVVLDVVEANVPPGPDRDVLLQRWYRGKVLKRLAGRAMLTYPEHYRDEFLDVVRPLVARRFPIGVDDHLAFPMRVRSALLRADRIDDLVALARIEQDLVASARMTGLRWEDERLRIDLESTITFKDGRPLEFAPGAAPGHHRWVPPQPLGAGVLTDAELDATRDLAASTVEVFVRAQHDGADYVQPVEHEELAGGVLRTTVAIDPRTARAGRRLTRQSDLVVLVTYAGWGMSTALRIDPVVLAASGVGEQVVGRRVIGVGTRAGQRVTVRSRRLDPSPPVPAGRIGRWRRRAGQVARRVRRRLRAVVG